MEQHEPTEEERIAAEKEAERLRRKRESNRKYMKKDDKYFMCMWKWYGNKYYFKN